MWPPVIAPDGFHRPRRVYDPRLGAYAVRLKPGDYYATHAEDEILVTVLGSCVSACIRNPLTGYGGMNHFMLPGSESYDWNGVSAALRYGNHAMEILINAVLKSGCPRERLEIKLFGGASFTDGPSRIGEKNAQFALHYLEREGLHPVSVDLGGDRPRVIQYTPATGFARRMLLARPDRKILERERRYEAELTTAPPEGDVELFVQGDPDEKAATGACGR
jgi:chemotaxis protein CheD